MVKDKTKAGAPRAAKKLAKKPQSTHGGGSGTAAPAATQVNWTKSTVTTLMLQEYVNCGELPPKTEISWRAAGEEIRPNPKEGEVVVFLDHVQRGFRPPPGSLFFRRVLKYYGLRPQDIAPNSVLNISNFVVFRSEERRVGKEC